MSSKKHANIEHIRAAIDHIDESVKKNSIAVSAALGIIYSITETLGTLIGDPDLPKHVHSGYESLAEIALELQTKIEAMQSK